VSDRGEIGGHKTKDGPRGTRGGTRGLMFKRRTQKAGILKEGGENVGSLESEKAKNSGERQLEMGARGTGEGGGKVIQSEFVGDKNKGKSKVEVPPGGTVETTAEKTY